MPKQKSPEFSTQFMRYVWLGLLLIALASCADAPPIATATKTSLPPTPTSTPEPTATTTPPTATPDIAATRASKNSQLEEQVRQFATDQFMTVAPEKIELELAEQQPVETAINSYQWYLIHFFGETMDATETKNIVLTLGEVTVDGRDVTDLELSMVILDPRMDASTDAFALLRPNQSIELEITAGTFILFNAFAPSLPYQYETETDQLDLTTLHFSVSGNLNPGLEPLAH